jgi:hypothetical protein
MINPVQLISQPIAPVKNGIEISLIQSCVLRVRPLPPPWDGTLPESRRAQRASA